MLASTNFLEPQRKVKKIDKKVQHLKTVPTRLKYQRDAAVAAAAAAAAAAATAAAAAAAAAAAVAITAAAAAASVL